MKNLIVVPRNLSEFAFLKKLLEQLESVKEVKIQTTEKTSEQKAIPFAKLSESSLAKEWLSKEDNVWDEWYEEKKKRKK